MVRDIFCKYTSHVSTLTPSGSPVKLFHDNAGLQFSASLNWLYPVGFGFVTPVLGSGCKEAGSNSGTVP